MKIKDAIAMKICPVCKKEFVYNPMSIYKLIKDDKRVHYCRYTCWRKAGGGKYEKDPDIEKELRGEIH